MSYYFLSFCFRVCSDTSHVADASDIADISGAADSSHITEASDIADAFQWKELSAAMRQLHHTVISSTVVEASGTSYTSPVHQTKLIATTLSGPSLITSVPIVSTATSITTTSDALTYATAEAIHVQERISSDSTTSDISPVGAGSCHKNCAHNRVKEENGQTLSKETDLDESSCASVLCSTEKSANSLMTGCVAQRRDCETEIVSCSNCTVINPENCSSAAYTTDTTFENTSNEAESLCKKFSDINIEHLEENSTGNNCMPADPLSFHRVCNASNPNYSVASKDDSIIDAPLSVISQVEEAAFVGTPDEPEPTSPDVIHLPDSDNSPVPPVHLDNMLSYNGAPRTHTVKISSPVFQRPSIDRIKNLVEQ